MKQQNRKIEKENHQKINQIREKPTTTKDENIRRFCLQKRKMFPKINRQKNFEYSRFIQKERRIDE